MFMNKFFLLLLLAVPSIAQARKDEICAFIVEQLEANRTDAQIQISIIARSDIDRQGATDLSKLILETTLARSLNDNDKQKAISGCNRQLVIQSRDSIRDSSRNRNGRSQNRLGGETAVGGGTSGGISGEAIGSGLYNVVELNEDSKALRDEEAFSAISHDSTEDDGHKSELTTCEALSETETCALPGVVDFKDIMSIPPMLTMNKAPLVGDYQHCNCIKNKVEKEYPDPLTRQGLLGQEKKKMRDIIISTFGKKFINNYAAHVEDVRFFSVNSKHVFGADPVTQSREAEKLLCTKQSDFKAAIQSKCGRSLTDVELDKKMDGIFSMLGQKANGMNYIHKLTEQVMVNSSQDGRKFKRDDYDIIRNGIVKNDLNIRFADNMIAEILKDRRAVESIMTEAKTPYEGLMNYVSLQLRTDSKRFLNRYSNKEVLGQARFDEISNKFTDSQTGIATIFGAIDFAMTAHPGFENLMRNNDLFKQTAEKIKNRSNSAIDSLESTENLMKGKFAADCERLKSDLAQVVCTKDSDLISSISKNELRHLIKASEGDNNLLVSDLAICRDGSMNSGEGAFEELMLKDSDRKSDILERLAEKDITKHKNLFSKIMLQNGQQGDANTQRFIAKAAEEGYRNRRGIDNDSFGSQFNVKESEKVSFYKPEANDPSKNSIQASVAREERVTPASQMVQFDQMAPMAAPFANNYASQVAPEQNTSRSIQEKDHRSELREFLSNRENQENVDRLMRGADDSQIADLARLRAESERNREELLKLATENEKLKLRQMEQQIADLEERRSQAVAANVTASFDEEEDSDPRSSGRGSRDIASVSSGAGESSGVNSGAFSGNNNGGTAGSSGSERTALNNLRSELANGTQSGNEVVSTDPVVISSAQARNGSLEIKSTELSNEILSFLETEPDVQTLIKMRNSGMIYKYKVVENGKEVEKEIVIDYKALNEDVKKLIDQKIADSGRGGSDAQRLSAEIRTLKRTYSYNALKIIIGERMTR